jgi:hypothetical protein
MTSLSVIDSTLLFATRTDGIRPSINAKMLRMCILAVSLTSE